MKISAFKCPTCLDTVYSRCIHDFRTCECWNEDQKCGIFVDGGFDYSRYVGHGEFTIIDINITKKQLYDDWNTGENKFGLIKNGV